MFSIFILCTLIIFIKYVYLCIYSLMQSNYFIYKIILYIHY